MRVLEVAGRLWPLINRALAMIYKNPIASTRTKPPFSANLPTFALFYVQIFQFFLKEVYEGFIRFIWFMKVYTLCLI